MKTVLVLSPSGTGFEVGEVVVEREGRILAWHDSPDGAVPSRNEYKSLDEAIRRNSRATSHAISVEVGSIGQAINMVGKPPPNGA